MKKHWQSFTFLIVLLLSATISAQQQHYPPRLDLAPDIQQRLLKLPRTVIDYDHRLLSANDRKVVAKLIEVSKDIEDLYWQQVSEDTPAYLHELLKWAPKQPQYRQAFSLFYIMKGRWDRLKENEPFLGPFGAEGKKPAGAGFYPTDMTKDEFEKWIAAHPQDKETFQNTNTVISRQDNKLVAVPYSVYYAQFLKPASAKLLEAAKLTQNASLKNYLTKLSAAFLSNDYFQSDTAWMDLNSPIEVVIGPYEVYEDALFNYKASFESFVTVTDKAESQKLSVYAHHLPDMEKNLPIPDEHKNPNRGTDSPIRVVQEIYTAGDSRRGVQTSAFNLPNDERVRQAKGSKKVILKNVMQQKFRLSGDPIARRVLDASQVPLLSFNAYFNHTLFHELSHGLGPGIITGPDGKKVENRLLLKESYSTIEECKADVLGLWNLQYMMDQKILTSFNAKTLYATNIGLMFRSMRFGIDEAHGRGTAVQWNWFREKGAVVPATQKGRFKVDFTKTQEAVRSLANELLMIEATGDYARAQRLLEKYGKATPEMASVNARLTDIPVDIAPVFAAAGER